jgi:hypothetical protein
MSLEHPLARRALFGHCHLPLLAAACVMALLAAPPTLAQTSAAAPVTASVSENTVSKARLASHLDMARRMYQPQMTPHWPTKDWSSSYTAEGTARPPWKITTLGPLTGESSMTVTGAPATEHTGEFQMYWSRIPDFRIAEYKVWPTDEGWIARIIYVGTAKDGTPVRAHQVDIVSVDDTGKVTRIEWHCDAGEWIRQVWTKASGLSEPQVRDVLAKPKGFERLIDISLGRASAS